MKKPEIIFIIGGPGVGKGTICGYLRSDYPNKIITFSTGDILRSVVREKKIEGWEQLDLDMKKGNLINSDRILFYLKESILSCNNKTILIDGFPRNFDNLNLWDKTMQNIAEIKSVFYFEGSHEIMMKRIHKRKDGRDDDKNDDIINKRIEIFEKETKPLIDIFEKRGNIIRINCNNDFDKIYSDVKNALKELKVI